MDIDGESDQEEVAGESEHEHGPPPPRKRRRARAVAAGLALVGPLVLFAVLLSNACNAIYQGRFLQEVAPTDYDWLLEECKEGASFYGLALAQWELHTTHIENDCESYRRLRATIRGNTKNVVGYLTWKIVDLGGNGEHARGAAAGLWARAP
jgi:hypothetical protein